LAGTEAAWQAAESGISVNLYEMRPQNSTGAPSASIPGEITVKQQLF
jgi:methylenetetrahydrofolate--tRNA-(uracil-5-)-methyltransferase